MPVKDRTRRGNATAGLILAIVCGCAASFQNFGLAFGSPLVNIAIEHGGKRVSNAANAVWLPLLVAGAIPNLFYCGYLLGKNSSGGNFLRAEISHWMLAFVMGAFWFGSLLLYGASVSKLGSLGPAVGWPLYMSLIVVAASLVGMATESGNRAGAGPSSFSSWVSEYSSSRSSRWRRPVRAGLNITIRIANSEAEAFQVNSRERVSRAIHFQRPDRLPISHAILPSAQYHYGEALKAITDAVPEDFGWSLLPDLPPDKLPAVYKFGRNRDDFGTLWHVSEQGRCGIPIEYPIPENWEGYEKYQWPVFGAGVPKYRLYSGHMSGTSGDYYARGGWITFFEQMQQLHGFSETLIDLAEDRRKSTNYAMTCLASTWTGWTLAGQ